MSKLAMARRMIGGHIVYPYRNKPRGLAKTSPFDNKRWNERKVAIADRVRRHQEAAHNHRGSGFRRTQKIKKRGYKKQSQIVNQ